MYNQSIAISISQLEFKYFIPKTNMNENTGNKIVIRKFDENNDAKKHKLWYETEQSQ